MTARQENAGAPAGHLQPRVFASTDAREGATAFIERRDPVWTGR